MVENKQDVITRARTMLSSLRKNIDQMATNNVPETYVHEFHAVLTKLEGIGIDVSEFRIPDSEIAPRVKSIATLTGKGYGKTTYSKDKYVSKSFILTKLDAVLGYLTIITSEKPRNMGYPKPEK